MNLASFLRIINFNFRVPGFQRNLHSLYHRKNFLNLLLYNGQSAYLSNKAVPEKVISGYNIDLPEENKSIRTDILSEVNTQINSKTHSRLFAIIHLNGRKFKVTTEDVISLIGYFPAKIGDKLHIEKVQMIGSKDFTLLGRPLLHKDLVRIDATVLEKTYAIPRPIFRFFPRKKYRRLHWFRTPLTLLRINSIKFQYTLDELPTIEGLENRVIY